MKKLFDEVLRCQRENAPAVLCVTVASGGSAPQGAGAWMLAGTKGLLCGTVGGGAVEHACLCSAARLIAEGTRTPTLEHYDLSPAASFGMACGGQVTVRLCPLWPGEETAALARAGLAALEDADVDTAAGLPTVLTVGAAGVMLGRAPGPEGAFPVVAAHGGLPGAVPQAGSTQPGAFALPLRPAGRVVLFGSGHVARQLAPLLAALDFRCVVADDRPELLTRAAFPLAERLLLIDYDALDTKAVPVTAQDAIVVLTRGHTFDYQAEKYALSTPAWYLGVVGSRGKTAALNTKLRADGVSQAALDAVHAPIGLDIHSHTPAEVAVSIAAELVKLRAERRAGQHT